MKNEFFNLRKYQVHLPSFIQEHDMDYSKHTIAYKNNFQQLSNIADSNFSSTTELSNIDSVRSIGKNNTKL